MNSRKVKIKISWGAKIRHSRKFNFNFSLRQVVWWATTRWTSKTFVMMMTENWHSNQETIIKDITCHTKEKERIHVSEVITKLNKFGWLCDDLHHIKHKLTVVQVFSFLSDSVIQKIVIMKKYPSKDRPTKSQQQSGFRGNESEQP